MKVRVKYLKFIIDKSKWIYQCKYCKPIFLPLLWRNLASYRNHKEVSPVYKEIILMHVLHNVFKDYSTILVLLKEYWDFQQTFFQHCAKEKSFPFKVGFFVCFFFPTSSLPYKILWWVDISHKKSQECIRSWLASFVFCSPLVLIVKGTEDSMAVILAKEMLKFSHFRNILPAQQILLTFSGVRPNAVLFHVDLSEWLMYQK